MAITWSNNIDPTKRKSVNIGSASDFRGNINTNFIELFQECDGCIDEIHDKVSDLNDRLNDRIDELKKDHNTIEKYNTFNTQVQGKMIKEELWDQGYRHCNVTLKVPGGTIIVPCKIWANYTGYGSYTDEHGEIIRFATIDNIYIDGHSTVLDGAASAPYEGQVINYIVKISVNNNNGTWIVRGDYDCAIKREYIDNDEQVQKVSYKRSLSHEPKDDIKITKILGTNDAYLSLY